MEKAMSWIRIDWVDVVLQVIGVVIAGIGISMFAPYLGSPLLTDRPWFYASALFVGLALGYALRFLTLRNVTKA